MTSMFDVGDLHDAARLMTDFMFLGWHRMDFYMDGKRTHTVMANPDDNTDPTVTQISLVPPGFPG
jgi:hypothetical protein